MKRMVWRLALIFGLGGPLPLAAQTEPQAVPGAVPEAEAPPNPAGPTAPATVRRGTDQLQLDASQITGNQELPRVLYIVPWKRSEIGPAGRPANSLLDEVMAPVDRTEFRRELNYHNELNREQTP